MNSQPPLLAFAALHLVLVLLFVLFAAPKTSVLFLTMWGGFFGVFVCFPLFYVFNFIFFVLAIVIFLLALGAWDIPGIIVRGWRCNGGS